MSNQFDYHWLIAKKKFLCCKNYHNLKFVYSYKNTDKFGIGIWNKLRLLEQVLYLCYCCSFPKCAWMLNQGHEFQMLKEVKVFWAGAPWWPYLSFYYSCHHQIWIDVAFYDTYGMLNLHLFWMLKVKVFGIG